MRDEPDPIPEAPRGSFWDASPALAAHLRRTLPEDAFRFAEPLLAEMGQRAAEEVAPLAAVADRESPRLVSHDSRGRRVDRVVYHPAYREMERIAYGSGIVGLKYDAAVAARFPDSLHTIGFSLGYLFAMAEMSLFCPVCMTDGVARIVSRRGTNEQKSRAVPRLAARDVSTLWTGAMFVTERWGGSDAGAARTEARPDGGGRARLSGEKWFCSNVDAQAILLTAREPGASPGTKGLKTYLLLAEDNVYGETLRIRRLKEKLGVRSMPTGEVELVGAAATELGDFSAMAEMLNLSRLYNAVASAAVIGRALHEAAAYAERRVAFSRPVAEHALAKETLRDLAAEHRFALRLAFDAVAALDRADAGDAEAARLFRALVPLVKAATGKLAVPCVSEAMELVGGNGYIEESPLPRLLRDAQVLPIWEGTTNVLVLDAFRVARKERGHELLLAAIAPSFPKEADALAAAFPTVAEGDLRAYFDTLTRLYGIARLVETGETEAAERLRRRPLGLVPGARAFFP